MTSAQHERPVTVVGNGVAGHACAVRLAERGVQVVLVGPGLPFDRPPLSKRALRHGRLPLLSDGLALRRLGIELVDGVVERVDRRARRLVVRTARGLVERGHGPLVWATGLAARRLDLAGSDVLTLPDGFSELVAATAAPGRHVAVIGGGLVGCETAATLAERHSVTLIDAASRPLPRLDARLGRAAQEALEGAAVRFLGGCQVDRCSPGLLSTARGQVRADVVLAAAGVTGTIPEELGGGSSLETDERLRVRGADGVWACGDVAAFPHPRFGRLVVPHWDNAKASGVHAAESVLGATAAYRRDPYWFTDIGRLRVQQLGVPEAVVEWLARGDLLVGLDAGGRPACVQLVNAPTRLGEARSLLAA